MTIPFDDAGQFVRPRELPVSPKVRARYEKRSQRTSPI